VSCGNEPELLLACPGRPPIPTAVALTAPGSDLAAPENSDMDRRPRMFVPGAVQRVPVVTRRSGSGLVLPGVDDATQRLGPTPVLGENAFVERLTRVYLIAREYLEGFESARGRKYERNQWIAVLLAAHPAEEYLCQLAALNHAVNSEELTLAYKDRFLEMLADDAAEAVRSAMAGGCRRAPTVAARAANDPARDAAGSAWS
jgi:hypothetical protein